MNCLRYEQQLEEIVAGTAPRDLLLDAARHRETCASCRELDAMARAALTPVSPAADDLVGPVLSRTSGPACGASRERLCDLVDGQLDDTSFALTRSHMESCAECRMTAEAIAWMREELPGLASIDPDPRFVRDVMKATIGARRKRAARVGSLTTWWASLLSRPRFTWEAAYVGAFVVWLLFGAGFSPWRNVPERALELARLNPVQTLADRVQPASLGREVWESTGGKVLQRAEISTQGLTDRGQRMKEASVSLAAHGGGLIGCVFHGDLSGGAMRLRDMGADLKVLWDELWRREPVKDHEAQEA